MTWIIFNCVGLGMLAACFAVARGKPVANAAPRENRPLAHDEGEAPSKDLLH
jgi:hypothetical protein